MTWVVLEMCEILFDGAAIVYVAFIFLPVDALTGTFATAYDRQGWLCPQLSIDEARECREERAKTAAAKARLPQRRNLNTIAEAVVSRPARLASTAAPSSRACPAAASTAKRPARPSSVSQSTTLLWITWKTPSPTGVTDSDA